MGKIVYIIPGFHGSVKMVRYQRIIKAFKKRGFKVVSIRITWDRNVMNDYISEFLEQVNHYKSGSDEVYVFGFSLGAMIAFISANRTKPKALILGSLSPFFKEDLKLVKKSWKNYLGKHRLNNFNNFSFKEIVEKNKKYKTYLLVGEKEDKMLLQKARRVHQKIKNSKMIIIKDVRHNIKDKKYFKSIIRAIDEL